MLEITTFGSLSIQCDGSPVTELTTRKVEALLVYLACTRRVHSREVLAEMFWAERTQERSLGNLRVALTSLRKNLSDYVAITRETVALNPIAGIWLDVAELEQRFSAGRVEEAVDLYQGDFLEGFYVRGCPAFEDWASAERERARRIVLQALLQLVAQHTQQARYEEGINHATRLLQIDPFMEEGQRQLMRLLAHSGQRGAALARYVSYRQVLADELGAGPEEETTTLYELIQRGNLEAPTAPPLTIRQPEAIKPPTFLESDVEEEPSPPPAFVARERELERLHGFLKRALAGQGRVVFVTGGPGRGKTALLNEFARRAMEANPNLLVASGGCNAFSGVGDPYLPFREVMAMLTGEVEARWAAGAITREHAQRLWSSVPETVQTLLEHGPHVVPALVPGTALLTRCAAVAPEGAPWLQPLRALVARARGHSRGLEQSHLFQQLTNMLRALAEIRPLLLVLDDLQWADVASIGLLFHLGRRIEGSRILIAGACRPEEVALGRDGERHPLEKVMSELQRTYGDVWVDLTEVKPPEGRHFVDALLKTEPNRLPEDFKRALFEHTAGHPLFTVELLRAMQERGDLVHVEGAWIEGQTLDWDTLPARVEAVIAERIDRLEDELRDILSVASVEGEEFTTQVVARVQETGERELFRCLSHHLERRHRLVRGQGEHRVGQRRLSRYRFAHALFQQYLYNGLNRGECRLLHGEIAAALKELYAGRTDEIAAQLARHYTQAGDDPRALRYLSLAADVALAAYANEEAEGHYRRALELARNDSERAPLLAGLGEALSRQSRFDEAIETYRQGIELYRGLGDLDGVAGAYARAAQAAWWGVGPPLGLQLCQEGIEAVADAPESPNLCLLLHEAARAHHFSNHQVRALSLCQQALEMAERLGVVGIRADALVTWGILSDKTPEEALEALEHALELAEEAGLLHIAGRALNNLGVIRHAQLGDLTTERHYFSRAAALDRQVGNITGEIYYLGNLFESSASLGDFENAEASLLRIRHLLGQVDDPGLAGNVASLREAMILIYRGDWAEAVRMLRECQPASRRRGLLANLENVDRTLSRALLELCALGTAAQEADWDEATAALVEAIELGEGVRYPQEMVWCHCGLSVIRAHRGQFDDARAKLAEARSTAGQQPNPVAEAALLWAEATLAAAEERWPEALAAFDALVAIYARLGMRWDWARSLIDSGAAHLARGEPGDLARAQDLLRESQEMFEDMGIPRYAALVEDRLHALGAVDQRQMDTTAHV